MKTFMCSPNSIDMETLTVGEMMDILEKYPREMPMIATWETVFAPVDGRVKTFPYVSGYPKGEAVECLLLDVNMTY